MAKDVIAGFVVDQAAGFVKPDGNVELVGVDAGVARVRYLQAPPDPSCESCVLSSEDLSTFLMEMFAEHAPHIRSVEIEVVPAAR